jgi:solute carrier family 25 carnitine/acylcarnitine transporter 20/29
VGCTTASDCTSVRDIRSSACACALTRLCLQVRDTVGTALYFLEYDSMRHVLGRLPSGEQGPTPTWLPIHASVVPFVCGSLAGVTSWALIYPLDVCAPPSSLLIRRNDRIIIPLCSVKTKVQQRALAGEPYRGVLETFRRLIRGASPLRFTACRIIYN